MLFLTKSVVALVLAFTLQEIGGFKMCDSDKPSVLVRQEHNVGFKASEVKVDIYYECLCPYCIQLFTETLPSTLDALANYADFKIYPYGNAIIKHGDVICQHGEQECYGNMLHACALDIIKNNTEAIQYNICMMDNHHRSDDRANTECGKQMNIDSKAIQDCAKSDRGVELLKKYGEETDKIAKDGVPWVLINGDLYDSGELVDAICKAFKNPPPPCRRAVIEELFIEVQQII